MSGVPCDYRLVQLECKCIVQFEDRLRSVQAENQLLGRVVQDFQVDQCCACQVAPVHDNAPATAKLYTGREGEACP